MLNIKRITFFSFISLWFLYNLTSLPWQFFLAAFVVYIVFLVYGSSQICSNFYLPVQCSAKTNTKQIAITFDDGPDNKITPFVLQTLREFKASATFFCIGKKIEQNPELLIQISNEGHLIGNHSYSHAYMFGFFRWKRMLYELYNNEELIKSITQKRVKLFRPPYGVTNPNLKQAVNKMLYITIGWNLRSLDTVKSKKHVIARVKRKLKSGSIILFHDNRKSVVEILRETLIFAKENQYEIVSLDKLLNIRPYD